MEREWGMGWGGGRGGGAHSTLCSALHRIWKRLSSIWLLAKISLMEKSSWIHVLFCWLPTRLLRKSWIEIYTERVASSISVSYIEQTYISTSDEILVRLCQALLPPGSGGNHFTGNREILQNSLQVVQEKVLEMISQVISWTVLFSPAKWPHWEKLN